ncbi:MAG TPA: hypothetical protein VMX94_05290 [Armatimonadota bacterium]|nr:hypothetical protein [Armatimonadota bacterium]
MYCKWCGMESDDDGQCTWCGRLLSADEPAAMEKPPPTAAEDAEGSASGLLVGEATYEEPQAPAEPAAETKRVEEPELPPFGVRFEKYLSIMLILLAGGMLVVHYYQDAWLSQFFPLLFISGLLLGIFKVIPDYDEKSLPDVYTVLAIAVLIGPVYAAVLYWFFSSIRQKVNSSVFGLIASYLVIRIAIGSAAHGFSDTVTYLLLPNLSLYIVSHVAEAFPLAVLGGGWVLSSFAQPVLDELGES